MDEQNPPSTRVLSRTRGAASGVLLVLLGAWGALAPFIGPALTFAFTPDKSWHWTAARGWYEVLPGATAFVGGLLLLFARSRAVTVLGAWLAILAGTWFIIGPAISSEVTLGSLGQPIGSSSGQRVAETLSFFYGLGAVILYLAATAFGRLSVVTVRDLRIAERREAERRRLEEDENDRLEQERFDRERYERDRRERRVRPRERAEPARNESGRTPRSSTSTRPGSSRPTSRRPDAPTTPRTTRRSATARASRLRSTARPRTVHPRTAGTTRVCAGRRRAPPRRRDRRPRPRTPTRVPRSRLARVPT